MMFCQRLLSNSLLVTFLYISSSTVALGAPHFHSFRALPPAAATGGGTNDVEYEVDLSWGTQRSAVEGPIAEPIDNGNSPLILAPRRTYRKDPLNGFKRYSGGWNITNHHYWASVGYTAAPLFAIATVWFLVFGLSLLLLSLCYFCCKKQAYGYSRVAYALSLIFLVIFSIGAIIGCVVLYTAQGRFHNSTKEALEYVVNQADAAMEKMRTVSDYIASAKLIGVDQVFLPSNVQTDIDQIETRINSSISIVDKQTTENSDDIQDLLDSMRLALITVAAIMLLLTFLGLLFSILGMQTLVYVLVILGWILVAGTFILSGAFLLLHNAAGDTCVAMHQWVLNPTAHTALDDILPCMDAATAQETLVKSKEITSQLAEVISQVITNVSNINFSPNFRPFYFNQSGPLVPVLCNPFYSDLTDRPCSYGEVDFNNATQVWSGYVCQVSTTGTCTTTGRLTPTLYNQMMAAVNVSNALYTDGPFLIELGDCTFARETFTDVYNNHCPHIRLYSRWIYIGLVIVSTAVMLSLIFWVIYGRERRHRARTKQLGTEPGQVLEENKHS